MSELVWRQPTRWSWETADGKYYIESGICAGYYTAYNRTKRIGRYDTLEEAKQAVMGGAGKADSGLSVPPSPTTEARELIGKLVEALESVMPIAVVQGDAAQHTNPHAKQMVNSNCAWLITAADRTAHKLRVSMSVAQQALAEATKWMEKNNGQ